MKIAFEILKDGTFDLALLDMNLGHENGLDVLDKLQKQYPDLPVVVFMRRLALDKNNVAY